LVNKINSGDEFIKKQYYEKGLMSIRVNEGGSVPSPEVRVGCSSQIEQFCQVQNSTALKAENSLRSNSSAF